ncbi:RPM1-interacting protein 4-like isoform X1 [Chenopodium quinoa]|uniref:RIN4 pathogenic type III effector avirulence factor Avr cleavage site domain-containing protein n=1 Tax=Chenopodium quinoa TaxID=63459 RepID=A0A803LTN2_CHEQI|nr:RPM1-interacting protein 4-like isoform X1 [Chenopodium quinoa]
MWQRTNVPKFGNWETEEDVPYTTYFENARRVTSSDKGNPNNSPDNPNVVSKFEARRGSEAVRAKQEHMVSQEDGEPQRSYDSPSRCNGGRKASVNSTHHRPAGVSSDSPKRATRANGGGMRSANQSPLHPHYQANIGTKGTVVSSPSRERKGPSDGGHGLAPSTPGRSRLRSVARGNETPDRGASVPKFGEWDETDPSSADGFSVIFNKVKEERHGSVGSVTGTAVHAQQSDGKHYKSKKNKGCGCLPW